MVRPMDRERAVHVGAFEPRFEEEVQDRVLELAAGGGVAGREDPREVGGASAGAEAVSGFDDLADRDEVSLRLADVRLRAR